jgi:hypothetical protein
MCPRSDCSALSINLLVIRPQFGWIFDYRREHLRRDPVEPMA